GPSAPPPSTVTVITNVLLQVATRYQYEITQDRAAKLPPWDQRSTLEPPLSLGAARKAAEAWLTSRSADVRTFELSSIVFLKFNPNNVPTAACRLLGCWYYRISFDPVVGNRRLNGGSDFTAIVLL